MIAELLIDGVVARVEVLVVEDEAIAAELLIDGVVARVEVLVVEDEAIAAELLIDGVVARVEVEAFADVSDVSVVVVELLKAVAVAKVLVAGVDIPVVWVVETGYALKIYQFILYLII